MKKLSILGFCGWAMCGVVGSSTVFSQDKSATYVGRTNVVDSRSLLAGEFDESIDEWTLMLALGIDERQAALEDRQQLEALNVELALEANAELLNPVVYNAPAIGAFGPLDGSSPVRTKNRYGVWQTAGQINLVNILDATWGLGSGILEDQIYEYLQNARAEYHRFRLNGFYDISINLADSWDAISWVHVSADKKHMYITYDLPGNEVSCTANLTSPFGWPDRDVRITTTVRIEVTMDVTGNLASPTQIRNFRISLRDTQCWNDGILFRETFNERVESEVNGVSAPGPLTLGQFVFGSVNTRLVSFVTPQTTQLYFEYDPNISSVAFKLDSRTILGPAGQVNTLPASTLQK